MEVHRFKHMMIGDDDDEKYIKYSKFTGNASNLNFNSFFVHFVDISLK